MIFVPCQLLSIMLEKDFFLINCLITYTTCMFTEIGASFKKQKKDICESLMSIATSIGWHTSLIHAKMKWNVFPGI